MTQTKHSLQNNTELRWRDTNILMSQCFMNHENKCEELESDTCLNAECLKPLSEQQYVGG